MEVYVVFEISHKSDFASIVGVYDSKKAAEKILDSYRERTDIKLVDFEEHKILSIEDLEC